MMTFGSGYFGGWLMILAPIALVVGVVLIALWAVRLLGAGAEDDALRQLRVRFARGEIHKGEVIVIRYEGPKGGPGMPEMLTPTSVIMGAGMGKDVALIT